MSTLSEISDVSGQKLPEKSTFSQTCSLLSQFLREKGGYGDLNFGMTCTSETNGSPETSCLSAMDLFPTKENNITPPNLITMDLLSPPTAYTPQTTKEVPTLINPSAFKSVDKEPKSAQLTIFYGGQVIVYDDFPANKVEEIMSLARKGISQSHNTSVYGHTLTQPSMIPNTPIVCDLPIARKASLHRFLEKRKDRITAKAPYQTSNPMAAPTKPAESMAWLGLAAKSTL
ncbi:PREDICTED: protein TIFY 10A-like isoform X2 [Lupinus angustifolius]|uniref:protein TIFY 10A-like isoform X2 n=1 Tax=Lupinus angustifolius TaxID=3871 RepID=UPI00092F6339|nr:PREDICTED: protein TIFY 10A-like isoform X2 [Lupinus angustifolius]